ncbi:OmpA family protein [Novosphingobium sp. TH158]|uniref:OmpA family protein n=1 Tax=Novosphingobium sp. TH158 TaxID=2067455 RepID=UPI000C7A26E3|nr:OmpA family protein [Novosphingobium sp. TH158]PLK27676.1 cell envelope biogenesis protein OmpA [Novosphingobium sp. TH158]
MPIHSNASRALCLLALISAPLSGSAMAQQVGTNPNIVVTGDLQPDTSAMTAGPEIKGVITARGADRIRVLSPDGSSTIVFFNETTKFKSASGLFGSKAKVGSEALLNGLPVTVKTMQAGQVLLASQVAFKTNDLKVAAMIRNGTAQGFAEQTAATQALRGRLGDIDKYNVKSTSNVYFDTGKWALSPEAKAELCNVASSAEATDNALLLVVGYTDSVGDEEYNQQLSEKRAGSVINHLQQACRWKPYRVLTPTGMAESDPAASNDTDEGKAQNRRVAVNVLVSKSVDGM